MKGPVTAWRAWRARRREERAVAAALRSGRLTVRGYDGASRGRRWQDWRATSGDANSEVGPDAQLLRDRSRDSRRGNPYAKKILAQLVADLVGTGFRPQSRILLRDRMGKLVLDENGQPKQDEAANREVEALWDEQLPHWDPEGLRNGYGLQAHLASAFLESGEVFARRRWRDAADGLPLPFQVQTIEADQLDGMRTEVRTGDGGVTIGRVVQGIEYDPLGRRAAYWFLKAHPGSSDVFSAPLAIESVRVLARDVAHLADWVEVRPGQARGVPWLSAVLRRLRMIDDYDDAELERKRQEACTVAIVSVDDIRAGGLGIGRNTEGGALADPIVTSTSGDVLEVIEPGIIGIARNGKQVNFHTPTAIGGYEENQRVHLRGLSSGARVPYTVATGDLSQANFSSLRHELNGYQAQLDQLRELVFVPVVCARMWSWFLEAAFAVGRLEQRVGGYPVEWFAPAWPSVDREKDAKADQLELQNETTSVAALVRGKGRDPDAVAAERASEKARGIGQSAAAAAKPGGLAAVGEGA